MSSSEAATTQGPPPAIHWDPVNAYHGSKLGMWLFLATEILLFGVLFAAFGIFRYMYMEQFHDASTHLDWKMGGINTLVLIASSFTAALAVDAAQHGDNKKTFNYLAVTVGAGFIFLIVKYLEYSGKASHGLFPFYSTCDASHGDHCYNWGSPEFAKEFKMYFGLYYCMTMLHALHVVIGMGVLTWALLKAKANRYSAEYYTPVEMGALYWHLVDLIWIYLFPLLYLVD